jgi:hypothetical protein
MDDDFTLRVLPKVLPETPAGRLEFAMNLWAPPIYCECGCDRIVGYGEPMIDRKTFMRIMDSPSGSDDT